MVNRLDEEWLKKVLEECFSEKENVAKTYKEKESFRILITQLIENIEDITDDLKTWWEIDPESEEVKKRFFLLKKHLFFLKRYCIRC